MVLLGTVHTVITIIKAHWLYGPETEHMKIKNQECRISCRSKDPMRRDLHLVTKHIPSWYHTEVPIEVEQ
jgi:hypothetical protein